MIRDYVLTINSENEQYLRSCVSVDQPAWLSDSRSGVRYRFAFPNGYEASVIKFWGSYGWEDDLWEMALIKNDHVVYINDFENYDTLGCLTDEEVNTLLSKISKY